MEQVDTYIANINKVICSNISAFCNVSRGFLSQNILFQLRNLVDHTALKAFSNGRDIAITYQNIEQANQFVHTKGNLNFLYKFHKLLQITTSHYTLDPENSERLMLKYYEYLLKIKSYLYSVHNLTVLENIAQFPLNTDTTLKEYYEKIAEQLQQPPYLRKNSYNDRYYILKSRPFFVSEEIYYEVTFSLASNRTSKFDRLIAFTKHDISTNYATKLLISESCIQILGKQMPILIIDDWEISIRPCELNNFAKIFGIHHEFGNSKEISGLMTFLTKSKLSLVEFIDSPQHYYQKTITQITKSAKNVYFLPILDRCRKMSELNLPGNNVIRYLLHKLHNVIVKQQYSTQKCEKLSNLFLSCSCIPFDQIPYNTSLVNHNPRLSDLFQCIDPINRESELFARFIRNNIEIKNQLYTNEKELEQFVNIDKLIREYNAKLYFPKHASRQLLSFHDHIYIQDYENDTIEIIRQIQARSAESVNNYTNSVDVWLQTSTYDIDCKEKKESLRYLFAKSRVALIYGSAGTGKSTMINHISNFLNDKKKIYLANTNPAVDNLKRKVNAANCCFMTITKFISSGNKDKVCDVLFIDECSTVSNKDMLKVLNDAEFRLLVLVGDIFQIESITFGNWFGAAKAFVPQSAVFELEQPYRSKNKNLLTLWQKVRNIDNDILEHITRNNYSATLNESIFEKTEKDEIILCLNYDGLYGINNINRFLQSCNPHEPIQWGIQTYKVGDPVLFNESNRFAPIIYNNMKGQIIAIDKTEDVIRFDIEVMDAIINELDVEEYDFDLVEVSSNGYPIIRFTVNRLKSTDDDNDSSDTIVPFQIAYAVSIHKAQGLEYDSVKIIITNEIEELITHNIFYTAITRAKERLKIYWTPETEHKILTGLIRKFNNKDIALLKAKL